MNLIRAYKFRFYPSNNQRALLDETMRLCCLLYNAALEQRRYAYEGGHPTNYREQQDQLPAVKQCVIEFKMVHSQVLQDVLRRVDRAFEGFFERVRHWKMGNRVKAGYPRFKPTNRYNSITYPQAQKYKIIEGHVVLPKIGKLRVFMHRAVDGEIKSMLVKRDHVGDWYIILNSVLPDSPRTPPHSALGIDVGLRKLVQASNGEFVQTMNPYRHNEERLRCAQRQLSHKIKGSRNREKARIKVAKIHRKIQRQREYLLHKISKELVARADLLVFEDLPIANMVKNGSLSKSIYDASWGNSTDTPPTRLRAPVRMSSEWTPGGQRATACAETP